MAGRQRRAPTAAGAVQIIVAETQARRARTQRVMLFGKLLVDFAELDMTLLLIWIGVYYGLRPLESLDAASREASVRASCNALMRRRRRGNLRPVILAFNRVLELLQHAAQAQQRFVADAAHQMRTPVAGLLAQIELLLKEPQASAGRCTGRHLAAWHPATGAIGEPATGAGARRAGIRMQEICSRSH